MPTMGPIGGESYVMPAPSATVPVSSTAGGAEKPNSVPLVPGAVCPSSAMLVRLPPEPLKMPFELVTPVVQPRNAIVPALFNVGPPVKEENVAPPVPGALWPLSATVAVAYTSVPYWTFDTSFVYVMSG